MAKIISFPTKSDDAKEVLQVQADICWGIVKANADLL